jgi:hypothetical protein
MTTGSAYTPGLKASARTRYRVQRILPVHGDVIVAVGDRVDAQQVVAQTFLPGDITPLNMAKLLAVPPADVPECMIRKAGDAIAAGELLARTKGIFGWFRTEFKSPVTGTIESISAVTGQVIVRGAPLPIQVKAFLAGEITEVLPNEGCTVEAEVTLVQGIFGIGGEVFGPIRVACARADQNLTGDRITPAMSGAVIVGGARVTADAIDRARAIGAAAIVSGGIDDEDLRTLLGHDLGVAITGSEQVGITVIVTEGFGEIAMADRTFGLFTSREGDPAAANGATQIRAGVMRPEIVVPISGAPVSTADGRPTPATLDIGATVRIIRDPYFGRIGTVSALPLEPQVLESGSRARVLEVTFGPGDGVIIPRANVELIEE